MADSGGTLRMQFYDRLRSWKAEGLIIADDNYSHHLWLLLGRDHPEHKFFSSNDVCTEAELAHLRALLGPHGYAYYRMLLARLETT